MGRTGTKYVLFFERYKQMGIFFTENFASKRKQNQPTQERTQNQVYLNYVERQGGRQDVNSEQIQDRKAGLNEKAEMRKRGGEYKQANSVVQGSFCLFMLWHIKKNDTFVMNMWQLCDNCKRLTKL
jgi:hypothetical protein